MKKKRLKLRRSRLSESDLPDETKKFEPEIPAVTGRLDKNEEIANLVINGYLKSDSRLIFVENDGFYLYRRDQGYYKALQNGALQLAIREATRELDARRGTEPTRITEGVIKNVKIALQNLLLAKLPNIVLNSEKRTLNLKNGILNLNTRELRAHSESFFSTVQLPVNYDPEARCPIWIQTLEEIFANDPPEVRRQKIRNLQMYFGLCLTNDTSHQKILIMMGDGANGKSLIIGAIQQVLGVDNFSSLSMEQLSGKFNLIGLYGKQANFSTEFHSNGVIPDEILKKISGEDWVEADRKYKDLFRFKPFAKLIFSMNDMPVITDRSHAFFRRLMVIKFTRIFKGREQDYGRAKKLALEMDGIFLWMLEGLEKLERRGRFIESDSMKEAVQEFKRENNNVIGLHDDWLREKLNSTIPKNRLYRAHVFYCAQNGTKPFTQSRFSRILKSCFPNVTEGRTTGGARVWIGLEFNEQAPEVFRRKK